VANNISFIIELQNRFSREADKIRASVRRATAGFDSFNRKIKKASINLIRLGKKAKQAGKSLVDFGKKFALRVSAPIAAFNALSIRGFDKQDKALAKITRTVLTTGGAARLSVKQLTDEATKLQNKTLFGDETILNDATAVLLTFTGIAGENFLKTQKVVLDLSTLMGTDLKSAALQLGKALNDPVANLGALSRAGIQFSVQQKEVIKNLVISGQLSKAQSLILKELNTQFGGLAEAAALAGTGLLTQLFNAFGDLMEQIGKIQFEFLKPLIETLKKLSISFSNLSPGVKKAISIILLVISVIGPLIIVIGGAVFMFGALSVATGFLGISLGAIAVPILIIVGVIATVITIGLLLVRHWETIKMKAKELWEKVKKNFLIILILFPLIGLLIAAGALVIRNWDKIKTAAASLWGAVKKFFTFIVDLLSGFGGAFFNFLLFPLTKLIEMFTGVEASASSVFSNMIASVVEFGKNIIEFAVGPITNVVDIFSRLNKAVSSFVFGDDEEKKVKAVVDIVPKIEKVKAAVAAAVDIVPQVEQVKAAIVATPPAEIDAPQAGTLRSQTDINISLRAPEKVIESTRTRSTGNQKGLSVGMNVVTEGA